MRNLLILAPTLFLLFLLQHIATCAQIYIPPDNIAIDCGTSTSGNSVAPDGRKWTGDNDSKFSIIEETSTKSISATALSQQSSVNEVPYLTARISKSQFTYMFPVTAGQKFIRLHFYPADYQGFNRSSNFFSVKVGPYALLNNFSASLTADYLGEPSFFKEFCVSLKQNQSLNVTFTPSMTTSYAFINGIEIVSTPSNLYYSRLDDQGLPFLGQQSYFQIDNYTALQNLHRLNIGGRSIPGVSETGMYRDWYDDFFYMEGAGVLANTSMKLDYSRIPAYTAPDDVYRTARSTGSIWPQNGSRGSDRAENLMHNLSWKLPVDSGFRYLVRLHFCELDPFVGAIGDRLFSIYIDNRTAEVAFDVMKAAGGKGIPIYKDYVVMIENIKDNGEHTLPIALPPNIFYSGAGAILNGLEVFKLNNSDGNLAGPNPSPEPPTAGVEKSSPKADKSTRERKFLISIGGGGIGLLIALVLLCYIFIWRRRKMQKNSSYNKPPSFGWWLDSHFSLAEIKAATRNFHEASIIGVGNFGNVYKGFLDDGKTIVTIKRLNPESRHGVRLFKTEIEMLSQLRHIHLVSLIGYCNENNEMILVYDFMINGTLRDHLYDTKNDPLTWKQRLKICRGAATGLNYLHTEVKYTVIHRNVKTSNILLDDKFTAKVSDFGLPKIGTVNTGVEDNCGYLDPEYARGHPLTEKSDAYSFGVVLFEVLCGRKALDKRLSRDEMNLAHWVKKCIADGTIYQVIDPILRGKIAPECFKVFVEIAEGCIQEMGVNRPLMTDVMEKLGFALELQEAADAEKEKNNPGADHSYPEIVLPAARDIDVKALDSKVTASSDAIDDSGSFISSGMVSSTI